MFSGLAVGVLFTSPSKLKAFQLLALPVLAAAVWLIGSAWRRDSSANKVAELSPRVFAIICTLCLVVGLVTGIICGTLLIEP
jgi:hypothetical protein